MKTTFANLSIQYEDDDMVYGFVDVTQSFMFFKKTKRRSVASCKTPLSFWFVDTEEFTPGRELENLFKSQRKVKYGSKHRDEQSE